MLNDDESLLLSYDELYFDSNAICDGDGSENNPYKYLNSTSLSNCSIAHLRSGDYYYNSNALFISRNLSFVGESQYNTFIYNINANNCQECNNLSFFQVTLSNPQIKSYGVLDIKNCIFSNGFNSNIISHKSDNATFSSQINIVNSTFQGFVSYYGIFDIKNTVISVFNSDFYNNYAYYGGVIHSFNSSLTLYNSNFYNNFANVSGSVLYDLGLSSINFIDSNFYFNYVGGYGGVITCEYNSKININNSTFSNNRAINKEGGVLYINGSTLNINNSVFVNSSASFGGAICNLKSKTNITNTKFLNNTAIYDGGAIYNMYSSLNITQNIFNNNEDSGLFLDNSTADIKFSNFTNTCVELSYKNNINIDNNTICDDIFYSNLSLDRISDVPIYCGNYGNVNVTNIESYDGRAYNLNTSVKSQENGGNCWAFAALATLESCILKTTNQSIFDFSEGNMKNIIARFSNFGLNEITNGGGNFHMVSGYLSSWLGPVLENEDVYCPTNVLSPILDSFMHIQNIYYIPFDTDLIKEAVYKYGAVFYGFKFDESYLESGNYNYNGSDYNIEGHAVSIIGWDDNYSKDNFKCKPEHDGAWIVKNSWGDTSPNHGYLYISYENNKNFELDVTTFLTFILNESNNYNHNYQYDIACTSFNLNNLYDIYYSNNFTSSRDELLSAVSTYFLSENTNYDIEININNVSVYSQSGFMKDMGYYTIPLTHQLSLNKNDKFEVKFHLNSNNRVYAPYCNDNDITHILYPNNSSRYSYDNQTWRNVECGVVCIKAFTIVNERYYLIADNVTKYYHGRERFYVTLFDVLHQSVANKTIKIWINGVQYTRITDVNGSVSLGLGLVSGVYNVTSIFDYIIVKSTVTILSTVNGSDVVKMFRNGTQYYASFRDSNGNYLANGTVVRFNINGVMYDRSVFGDKGLAKLNINLEQGRYIITAINLETGEATANNITVLSLLSENKDLTKYYRNASQYIIKVLGEDGNPVGVGESVTFNINGVFYTRTTNESGYVKLNINLQPGDYIITAEYNGCMVSNIIKVLPILNAEDIIMRYKDGTQFVATLVDGQGHPYAGQTVQFNINGVIYHRVTDSSGQAKLNINLMVGKYIITSSYNGNSIANTITITS